MTVLALDVGDRRVGIAVSDPTELLARPHSVLLRRSNAIDAEAIRRIVVDLEVRAIVVGLPVDTDASIGPQAKKTRAYARFLRRALGLPIETWNESYSTVDAEQILIAQNIPKAKRRDMIDAAAAAVILDDWLLAHRPTSRPESTIEVSGEDGSLPLV
jgi:putative Holliday junction resolvase